MWFSSVTADARAFFLAVCPRPSATQHRTNMTRVRSTSRGTRISVSTKLVSRLSRSGMVMIVCFQLEKNVVDVLWLLCLGSAGGPETRAARQHRRDDATPPAME